MKVSICCITYNHEKYIAQALDSFLTQEFNDFEVIVSDDCSIDGTRAILEDYQKRYPEKIKLFLNDRNIGMMPNFVKALKACRGEFIALCEGDDFWIDSLKLQKQTNFLEQNMEYVFCAHNVKVFFEESKQYVKFEFLKVLKTNNDNISTELIINHWGLYTCSFLFRNVVDYPDWLYDVKAGDLTLALLLSIKGKIMLSEETMAVYRKVSSGATGNANHIIPMYRNVVATLNKFDTYTKGKFSNVIEKKNSKLLLSIKLFEEPNNLVALFIAFRIFILNRSLGISGLKQVVQEFKVRRKLIDKQV